MKKLFFVLVVAVMLVAACGGQPATSDNGAATGDKVTIRFWSHQNDAFNEAYNALADKYTAAHPDVEIQFETFDYDTYIQTLQTALPAKTEADILQMFGSWVCSYAEGNNLSEVPGIVISLADAQARLFEAPVGGSPCNGKLYGIPQEFNIEYGAVMVNTNLAAEAGVSTVGWANWDAFIADARKLSVVQDGVMTRAAFNFTGSDGIATMFHSLILQQGGTYLADGKYTVNTPEGMAALELMKRFVDEGLVDPVLFNDEENWVGDSYFEETSAIGLVGPWAIPEYSGDYEDVAAATVYVPLPVLGGSTPTFAAASGWGLTVSANSKVQDAAWDFVKFVTLDAANATEFNLGSGTLPALKANVEGNNADALVAEFPYFEPFFGLLQYGIYEGQFPDRDFVWYEVTYPDVLNYLQGNATADETLQQMDSEVNGSFE